MSKDEVGVPAAGRLLFSSIGRNLDEKKSGGVFKLKQKNEIITSFYALKIPQFSFSYFF